MAISPSSCFSYFLQLTLSVRVLFWVVATRSVARHAAPPGPRPGVRPVAPVAVAPGASSRLFYCFDCRQTRPGRLPGDRLSTRSEEGHRVRRPAYRWATSPAGGRFSIRAGLRGGGAAAPTVFRCKRKLARAARSRKTPAARCGWRVRGGLWAGAPRAGADAVRRAHDRLRRRKRLRLRL